MTYDECLDWLFKQLPMYQNKGGAAYKKDLTNINLFSGYLGNPHQEFKSIHVAGTNGKGSVSHMLASILQEEGYKVGLHTSPHLKDFRERIKINGEPIEKKNVVEFISEHQSFFEENELSFFEMTVGLAFHEFAEQKVDITVIEVGLGGRLDSTNIISPLLSVITNIGFDHTQFLGKTRPEIATEKAGIIKPETPVVVGEKHSETESVFKKIAEAKKASLTFAEDLILPNFTSDLKGVYQQKNIKTAVAACQALIEQCDFKLSKSSIEKGLHTVIHNTGLFGRWQTLEEQPRVIVDTGHNKEGLTYVLSQLAEEDYNQLHIVLGFVKEKDIEEILELFPKEAYYYFCQLKIERGMDVQFLQAKAEEKGLKGEVYLSVNQALNSAKEKSSTSDLIFIGGSTFTVAEII
ncbi:MAG: bifunctional folylpolyglutamate synthase/dihydrofolate synthase [Psychroflexus halocasei]|uniref:bifunctional folylpolyglutamate synthase/dihydrofolate synthase n=1 Tax=Psychroflexus sp. S27 TaxID=1982757 RepID=UPI000C2A248B|nr:folylpolyglutamate synthase/dihydrofolate synthase family protein [Psychroflexus sp. S27]PJX21815.1 tetrahydrofolate synthase [Psychroflexus sp. S27]